MSDDEQCLGDLFAAADDVPPDYPLEELLVDRNQLAREGETNCGFEPLWHRFDSATPAARSSLSPLRVFFRNKRHSLWGHKLWNAARYLVKRMDSRMIDVRGRTVLELGAGLGVPSLAAFKNGARRVVVTDYPDEELLDIIERNVRENCRDGEMDADARAFLLEEAKRMKQRCSSGSACGELTSDDAEQHALSEEEIARATETRCVVEPLLWGKESHIQQVLSHTGGASVGFDIVLLSDILFNHVCNADLVNTVVRVLQRSAQAAAYCVFSHHRAHKQVEDFEFFDICVSRGLHYEEIDQEDYPMMFPEDEGPEEIRKPVKVYKIVHCMDGAGGALEVLSTSGNSSAKIPVEPEAAAALPGLSFDVIVQGTGPVEGMISAALARSGLRVLHCDGQPDYGGLFKTLTVDMFRAYIASNAREEGAHSEEAKEGHNVSAVLEVDRMDELDSLTLRHFFVDLLPSHYLSRGETISQLVESDISRYMDFLHLSGFLFLTLDESTGTLRPQSVPLSRASIFAHGSVPLVQKRRLMKFVKDIEPLLAEQLHARTAPVGDTASSSSAVNSSSAAAAGDSSSAAAGDSSSAAAVNSSSAAAVDSSSSAAAAGDSSSSSSYLLSARPGESLRSFLSRSYGLRGAALDALTLRGELRAVPSVRRVLLSLGAFGGPPLVPLLVPLFGTSELAQNMCRVAAVWGATFVLRRSLRRVAVDAATGAAFGEMSNGQRVRAEVFVAPRALRRALRARPMFRPFGEAEEGEEEEEEEEGEEKGKYVRFARVVMIARRSLFDWAALQSLASSKSHSMSKFEEEKKKNSAMAFPPVVLALWEAQPEVIVHVQQQSAACEQAPGEYVVLHFTANARDISPTALRHAVREAFIVPADSAERTTAENSNAIQMAAADVLLFASFELSEFRDAQSGFLRSGVVDETTSETRKAHPYAIAAYRKRAAAHKKDNAENETKHLARDPLVAVQTVFEDRIDDEGYVAEARKAYNDVRAKLGPKGNSNIFLEPLPPLEK